MRKDSKETIDRWIKTIDNSKIVLVIGAGFSKNAIGSDGQCASEIPDLEELARKIREELKDKKSDAASLLGSYQNNPEIDARTYQRKMLSHFITEPDHEGELEFQKYQPGEAHKALSKLGGIRAIITTNCLDMLLEQGRFYGDQRRIIFDKDIVNKQKKGPDIIYLHGHQSCPESWILTNDEYKEFGNKYPRKLEYTRVLLSMYPSVFIGFSFRDSNVNKMLNDITRELGNYSLGRLSFVANKKDTNNIYFKNKWKELKVQTALFDCKAGLSADVAAIEIIKYFVDQRNKELIKSGVLLPGIRTGSYHKDLKDANTENCTKSGDRWDFCKYHENRKDAIIERISPDDHQMRTTNLFSIQFNKDSPAHNILHRLGVREHIAGSWGLMPQHSDWLKKHYFKYSNGKQEITVLITGVAGLPHFIDTASLLLEANSTIEKLKLYVVDKCEGPLYDIEQFRDGFKPFMGKKDSKYYDAVQCKIAEGKLEISCFCMNIVEYKALTESEVSALHNQIDIVLSHKIASFSDLGKDSRMKKYSKFVSYLLKKDGILISAQTVYNGISGMIQDYNNALECDLLYAIDIEPSFDVYDQPIGSTDLEAEVYDAIKETLLSVHIKHKYE